MLIIEIDRFDAEPAQAAFTRRADIIWLTVDAAHRWIFWIPNDPEFRGNDHVVAPASNGAADKFLVEKRAVHIGGIEKVDPKRQRPVNGCQGFGVVLAAVEIRHPHAAQAHRRYVETTAS